MTVWPFAWGGAHLEGMDKKALEEAAEALEASGGYRVLRRLDLATLPRGPGRAGERLAVFVDVETTGLEPARDEIIALAIVPFHYGPDGRIRAVYDAFDALREPSAPIPAQVTRLTGLTDEAVRGRTIDEAAVTALVGEADLVVAHHAGFDRRFLERLFPIFATKPWACSLSDIDWAGEGYEGAKLAYLACQAGFFYDGHRALHDCLAALALLQRPLPVSGTLGMKALLASAREPTYRIWAEGAGYEHKDTLKARGYRWNAGEDNGKPRAWYFDASAGEKEAELAFLRTHIYRGQSRFKVTKITALERYSDRV